MFALDSGKWAEGVIGMNENFINLQLKLTIVFIFHKRLLNLTCVTCEIFNSGVGFILQKTSKILTSAFVCKNL